MITRQANHGCSHIRSIGSSAPSGGGTPRPCSRRRSNRSMGMRSIVDITVHAGPTPAHAAMAKGRDSSRMTSTQTKPSGIAVVSSPCTHCAWEARDATVTPPPPSQASNWVDAWRWTPSIRMDWRARDSGRTISRKPSLSSPSGSIRPAATSSAPARGAASRSILPMRSRPAWWMAKRKVSSDRTGPTGR
ncbi:hypothetical protein ACFFX0_09095 [Citricoccus parietis]|uniref:Uncharacterized protein n=1 Tax=Citricoccus parietis TaxID=592307 RepID=A0ABV5FXD7_9MICC